MVIYLVEGLKWRERRAERGAGGYQHPRAQEARTRADRGARTGVDNENEPARETRVLLQLQQYSCTALCSIRCLP